MKIRGSIIWFIVIAVAMIALVLWYGKRKSVEMPLASLTETNVPPPAASAPSSSRNMPVYANAPTNKMVKGADLSKSPPENKGQRILETLSTYNDVPINFYGRVEDQLGNAVGNATISFNVRINNGQESTVQRGQTITDGNGTFTILGYKGESLGVVPAKAGYALASTGTLFKYSHMEDQPYTPDANNPTVIKMWKLQGAEPLVSINQHYKLPYTDAPMVFDLLTGKIVPAGGDIKITVSRSPGIVSGRTRQDWSVQVEAVDGGLMDSSGQDRVTYAAPEDGYQPSDTFIMSTNAPYKWFGEFNQGLFVKSRNGQVYSKLGLSFRINQNPDDPMYITFSGIANANGSRNWEGDANTMKTVGQ